MKKAQFYYLYVFLQSMNPSRKPTPPSKALIKRARPECPLQDWALFERWAVAVGLQQVWPGRVYMSEAVSIELLSDDARALPVQQPTPCPQMLHQQPCALEFFGGLSVPFPGCCPTSVLQLFRGSILGSGQIRADFQHVPFNI